MKDRAYKYEKHSQAQFELILTCSEKLFAERGLGQVTITEIAASCGVMRATIYQYFNNVDEILWNIMRKHTDEFSRILHQRIDGRSLSTYETFEVYLTVLYESFLDDPLVFQFYNQFSDTYQSATADNGNPLYKAVYGESDYHAGDMVRLLTDHFDDGSVKEGLDAKNTTVSVISSATCLASGLSQITNSLPKKYGIETGAVLRYGLDALLTSLKP